jgi:hypothetical protein
MWNLHSCLKMVAGSAFYTIPGFERLKNSALQKSLHSTALLYAIFAQFALFLCRHCARYLWSFMKMLPLSRSSTTFHWRLTEIWRMFHACNTYLKLTKILLRKSCVIHTQFITDSVQIMRGFPWNFHRAQPHIRPVWDLCVLKRWSLHGLLAICA